MKPAKIGFVLLSNRSHPLPSTRIGVLNMLPLLRDAGFQCEVVYEPPSTAEQPELPDIAQRLADDGFDVVLFQKVRGPSVLRLAARLGELGVKTVFAVCDVVDVDMVRATDATIAVTEYLRALHPSELHDKITVVHDGIEHPIAHKTQVSDRRGSRADPLHAVLVVSTSLSRLPTLGSPPDWLQVTVVGDYPAPGQLLASLRQERWTLQRETWAERRAHLAFLADRRIRRVAWHPSGVYERLLDADIGIIPIDTHAQQSPSLPVPPWMAKSENRLTLKMAAGLPVVATPIPSYESVVEQGVNGFLARTRAQWLECLEALRDPERRRAVGARARSSVIDRFSQREQARRLVDVLHRVLGHPVAAQDVPGSQPR